MVLYKVDNRKVISRLANKSFMASRTRNMIAVIAIALTTVLFTTLFTIGLGTIENIQRQTMREVGTDAHGVLKSLTKEQYEKLRKDPLIKESAACILMAEEIQNEEFLKRHVEMWYYPQEFWPHLFVELKEGRAPETADEILMDEVSMELLGLEPTAGQQAALQMMIRSTQGLFDTRTFTVSGVIRSDPVFNVGYALVSEAYVTEHEAELAWTGEEDGLAGAIQMEVVFDNSMDMQGKLYQVVANAGYSNVPGEPDYIASNSNWGYVSDGMETDFLVVGSVAGGLFLILLTGYLIIYNIFQISVIRDIRYYGLLKTIGTTGYQVKRILRRQALRLGITGLPFGLIIGFILGKSAVPLVIGVSSLDGGNIKTSLNPWIFVGAAVFSMLTVLISSGKPARIAAKVSPVEAVRYTQVDGNRKKQKRSTDGGKLWRMALSNLGRNKKRTVIVLLSLSLSVVLLNSVFTLTKSFEMDAYLSNFVMTDFQIGHAKYFGMSHYTGTSEETVLEENLSESFISVCQNLDGFEEGGRLYGTLGDVIGLRKSSWMPPSNIPTDTNGDVDAWWSNNELDEEYYSVSLYGMEDYYYKYLDVWKGESDTETIRQKLKSGNYLVYNVATDDNGVAIEEDICHQPGDKIILKDAHGREREFEILSLVREKFWNMTCRSSAGPLIYYVDASVFIDMASDSFLMNYAFDVEDGKEESVEEFLSEYTTTIEPLMDFASRQTYVGEFWEMVHLIIIVGVVLAVIVGFIGILNFVNSILTDMVTRRQEFAVLEAIGMTRKQLMQMLILEGFYYAVCTVLSSIIIGFLFSQTLLRTIVNSIWFMKYRFVILPIFFIAPLLLVLGLALPGIAFKLEKKESVVERLRKIE